MDYPEGLAALGRRRGRLGRDRLKRRLDQIANRPRPIGDTERHCRGHPQGFMRAAQIVERDMKADGGEVAIDLLAEAIAEPRKPL